MAVPNIFGSATSAIPLSQLDQNFATAITLGNTAVYLGNTTTSLGNVTLTNVTISSGNVTVTGANVSGTANVQTLAVTQNATVAGNVTVTGNVSMNVATITTSNVTTENVSSLIVTGNQTFVGTGNRITGDFSNATVANRVMFQTSTTNGNTVLNLIPNGTGTTCAFNMDSDPALTNSSTYSLNLIASTEARLNSGIRGTGTYLPMTFYTGGSERMRVDTSGNVGIGTSSPNSYANYTTLTINGTDVDIDLLRSGTRQFALYTTSALTAINNVANLPLAFYTNNAERMRIDSSGYLLINQTSNVTSSYLQIKGAQPAISCESTSTGSVSQVLFRNPNGQVGSISTSGSSTSYNTSSDYRLKQDIVPMTGALATVAQLKPVTYKWKVDGSGGQGFIAHELQEVCPDAVTGSKDAVDENGKPEYQGIDTSFLVATLTAAIQEQQALITALTARIEALEAK